MLDTVLKIGNIYRNSNEGLKHHRYILSLEDQLKREKKLSVNDVKCYIIPVKEKNGEFIFDLDKIEERETNDEDYKNSVYYLNFKETDSDGFPKYLFGDIVVKNADFKITTNYKVKSGNKKTPFELCEKKEIVDSLKGTIIERFRKALKINLKQIDKTLQAHKIVTLCFEFENGKRWHELDNVLELINYKILELFTKPVLDSDNITLYKFLYKTIGNITPNFKESYSYKVKQFKSNDFYNLLYSVNFTEYTFKRLKNIGICALPNLSDKYIEETDNKIIIDKLNLFFKIKTISEKVELEKTVQTKQKTFDNLFETLVDNSFDDKVKFDIILLKPKSGASTPPVDLIEISSIEKSQLKEIHNKIIEVKLLIKQKAKKENENFDISKLQIENSFQLILGGVGEKGSLKYQFHLLKVLPQIYSGTYYQDPTLLPAFVEKVEYNIRNSIGEKDTKHPKFNLLKYKFYLLMEIQKKENLMEKSESYKLGLQLGILARPFAKRWKNPESPIASFEKAYVGNLTKKISSTKELDEFTSFLMEKLSIHEKTEYPFGKAYTDAFQELISIRKRIDVNKYNKHRCALGFFENYYAI